MNVYDLIMKALSQECIDVCSSSHLCTEQAIRSLSLAPHDASSEPRLMFAFDHIQYENDNDTWFHDLKIELYSIASVRGVKEIPALVELETELISDLLERDLGGEHITSNSWNISDMFLYFPKFALPRILNLGYQRISLLQQILDMNIPSRAKNVTEGDFFSAFCLGNYIPSQLDGIANHYLAASVYQGMEISGVDEDESVPTFFNELVISHEYEEFDSWPRSLTATEIMNCIAVFYNSFMQYRDLLFVKKRLESIIYDVENYAELVRFCKGY